MDARPPAQIKRAHTPFLPFPHLRATVGARARTHGVSGRGRTAMHDPIERPPTVVGGLAESGTARKFSGDGCDDAGRFLVPD